MGLNTNVMYAQGVVNLGTTIDFAADTIRAILVNTSYGNTTLDEAAKDTDISVTAIPATDRADSQFIALGTNDVVASATGDKVLFGGGTVSITFTTVTNGEGCHGIVVFKSSGTEAASELLSYNHFSATVTADGGDVVVTLHANGVFQASFV